MDHRAQEAAPRPRGQRRLPWSALGAGLLGALLSLDTGAAPVVQGGDTLDYVAALADVPLVEGALRG